MILTTPGTKTTERKSACCHETTAADRVQASLADAFVRLALLLDNVTAAPPAGAGAVRATVPTDTAPPTTEVGLSVKEVKVGAVRLMTVEAVTPLQLAAMLPEVRELTADVVTVTVALLPFAATVSDGGTCAYATLLA